MPEPHEGGKTFVLILRDKYEEESISAVFGPYASLAEAHSARRDLGLDHRYTTTDHLRHELPEWERDA